MIARASTLRLGSSLAALVLLTAGAIACKAKGNGIGTAPIEVPCPTARPEAASPCPDKDHVGVESTVCNYAGTCADKTAEGEVFFFCPGGTNAAWKCIEASETGPLDAATDAADGETTDGETSIDDADAAEADVESDADADAEETLDAGADALDDGDALDADGLTD